MVSRTKSLKVAITQAIDIQNKGYERKLINEKVD